MPRMRVDMVVCYVVRDVGGEAQALQVRRPQGDPLEGVWSSVYGKVEAGETAVQAAARELREETGLTPSRLYRLGRVRPFYTEADDTVWLPPAFAAVVDPEADVRLNEEHDAYRWIALSDAGRLFVWASDRESLEDLGREILGGGPACERLRVDP